jgi:hypothetical protein
MEYFAYGFILALVAAIAFIYLAHKAQDTRDNSKGPDNFPKEEKVVKTEGELEKDCFLIIFDRKEKILRSPKYNHDVRGPMAIDVYQWITGNKIEEDE